MSLDISVTDPETGETREMNWLRNPYGLCSWAEDNYNYITKEEPPVEQRLWYVINHWNYDKSGQVDRLLFLEVVQKYEAVVGHLTHGFFWFDVGAYIQFIEPYLDYFPRSHPPASFTIPIRRIQGSTHYNRHIGIPMDHFGNPVFELSSQYRPNAHTLKRYQEWFNELVQFAETLQKPGSVFYCSN